MLQTPFDARDHGPMTSFIISVNTHYTRQLRSSDAQKRSTLKRIIRNFSLPHSPVKVQPDLYVLATTDIAQMNSFKCKEIAPSSYATATQLYHTLRRKGSEGSSAGKQCPPVHRQSVNAQGSCVCDEDLPGNVLVNRRTALRAALAWNDPDSITALEAGRTPTSRNLKTSANTREYSIDGPLTGMVKIPSTSNMHGTATLSIGVYWHMVVEMKELSGR
jgi:hypothetical protein